MTATTLFIIVSKSFPSASINIQNTSVIQAKVAATHKNYYIFFPFTVLEFILKDNRQAYM